MMIIDLTKDEVEALRKWLVQLRFTGTLTELVPTMTLATSIMEKLTPKTGPVDDKKSSREG